MAPNLPNQKDHGLRGTRVKVHNNNMSLAMKKLKKILQDDGFFQELRDRQAFVKPSMKRKRAKAAGRKRHLKELELRNSEW